MVELAYISFILGEITMNLSNFLKPLSSLSNLLIFSYTKLCPLTKSSNINIITSSDETKVSISVSEVNMVMRSLGMWNNGLIEGSNEKKVVEKEVFDELFGEEEPCLEEIWEVFQVFDENKDGFIDAMELGRVLCSLGFLKEGSNVERCKKMIKGFDRNDDGLLDFNDFLMFMHTCLC